jgi:hypothetical protein
MVTFTVRCKTALICKSVPPKRWVDRLWRRSNELKYDLEQIVYITGDKYEAGITPNLTTPLDPKNSYCEPMKSRKGFIFPMFPARSPARVPT